MAVSAFRDLETDPVFRGHCLGLLGFRVLGFGVEGFLVKLVMGQLMVYEFQVALS